MDHKTKLLATLEGKQDNYIPVMVSISNFIRQQLNLSPQQFMNDAKTYVDANLQFQRQYGYDCCCLGMFNGAVEEMGRGLVNRDGQISTDGTETLLTQDLISQLNEFKIDECRQLKMLLERLELFKAQAPNIPLYQIVDSPSMAASEIMGAANYYIAAVKNPDFIHEVTELMLEPIAQTMEKLIEAGCEIMWLPMPTIGGACLSKKHYIELCVPYNKRFIKRLKAAGAKVIIHTCGNWNDRFDVVVTEGADAIHTSEADLELLVNTYGQNIGFMGQLSVLQTMLKKTPDEVYAEALHECMIGSKGSCYILSADCGLPASLPPENLSALVRAARDAEQILNQKQETIY